MTIRYAIRTISRPTEDVLVTARVIERYMPSNYQAFPVLDGNANPAVLIVGRDNAGWTLGDYVLPRLASGLYSAREITQAEADTYTRIGAS